MESNFMCTLIHNQYKLSNPKSIRDSLAPKLKSSSRLLNEEELSWMQEGLPQSCCFPGFALSSYCFLE